MTRRRHHIIAASPASPGGFTLTELLVVVGLIVLLVAVAVPSFQAITGSRSVETAENTVGPVIARARTLAIADAAPTGTLFYVDPATRRTVMQIVRLDESLTPAQLTRVDTDPQFLPRGIAVQLATDSTSGTTDRFLSMGLVLFDAQGMLVNRQYTIEATGQIGIDLGLTTNLTGLQSQSILMLIDREIIAAQGMTDTDPAIDGGGYGVAESDEELRIAQLGIPVRVNRYNGTLYSPQ